MRKRRWKIPDGSDLTWTAEVVRRWPAWDVDFVIRINDHSLTVGTIASCFTRKSARRIACRIDQRVDLLVSRTCNPDPARAGGN